MSVSSDWSVALVVCDDENDIRSLGLRLRLAQESTKRTEKHGYGSECRMHGLSINQVAYLANRGFAKALLFRLQVLG